MCYNTVVVYTPIGIVLMLGEVDTDTLVYMETKCSFDSMLILI